MNDMWQQDPKMWESGNWKYAIVSFLYYPWSSGMSSEVDYGKLKIRIFFISREGIDNFFLLSAKE